MTREWIEEIFYQLGWKLYTTSFYSSLIPTMRLTFVDRFEVHLNWHEFYFEEQHEFSRSPEIDV